MRGRRVSRSVSSILSPPTDLPTGSDETSDVPPSLTFAYLGFESGKYFILTRRVVIL